MIDVNLLTVRRKSSTFAALGGVKAKGQRRGAGGGGRSFATFKRDSKTAGKKKDAKCLDIRRVIWHTLSGKKN